MIDLHIFLTSDFQIIVGLHAAVRNNRFHIPFTQFCQTVIICITIVQYHHQEFDYVTIH